MKTETESRDVWSDGPDYEFEAPTEPRIGRIVGLAMTLLILLIGYLFGK